MTSRQTAAVIGCGDIAAIHLEAIGANPDLELLAVSDVDSARCADTATQLSCPGFADYREMLDSTQPDVVHICTPHHLHAEMAGECLRRGVNVLLEKPLATSMAQATELIDVADRSSAQLGVCFQNRYNPTSQRLRELLDNGEFGLVSAALATVTWSRTAAYYQRRPWRGRWQTAGGGVLMNQAIHTIDLLVWLLGDVVTIRGQAATLALGDVIEVEDTASAVLTHQGGQRSVFFATNTHADNSPVGIEIHAEKATLLLHSDLLAVHPDGRQEVLAEHQQTDGERAYWGASHGLLIDDFYRHVRDGRPFWLDGREAVKALEVVLAVYDQSDLAGREPQS